MVFTTLTLGQMAHVLAIRSETEPLWKMGLFSNRPLLGAVLLTLVLQLATIYVPWVNPLFHTQPLTVGELGVCLPGGCNVGMGRGGGREAVTEPEAFGHNATLT